LPEKGMIRPCECATCYWQASFHTA
jgi:hypothetical protein